MDRRETLKVLLTGSFVTGLLSMPGCDSHPSELPVAETWPVYGRTPEEQAHDAKIMAESFFTETERRKVDMLADIVIPADDVSGSATDARVTDFIEFMMKDFPQFQNRMRGGLMWLDHECSARFGRDFLSCIREEHLQVIDNIAWPDEADPKYESAVRFFTTLRNLTITGFYTTQMGFDDLGYAGNRANEWNGVPEHVQKRYGLADDPRYKNVYLKPEERYTRAQWDDEGNLIG